MDCSTRNILLLLRVHGRSFSLHSVALLIDCQARLAAVLELRRSRSDGPVIFGHRLVARCTWGVDEEMPTIPLLDKVRSTLRKCLSKSAKPNFERVPPFHVQGRSYIERDRERMVGAVAGPCFAAV